MAQNSNNRKSEGLCQKIYNAVSPLRSKNRRIENPVKISSPQTKPVQILHQPSLTKMIPIEYEPPEHFSAYIQSAGKKNSNGKPGHDFAAREILIVNGQKIAKSASRKKDKPRNHGSFSKARSEKKDDGGDDDDDVHEGKFSDYISKVKNRMIKSASNVNGGVGGTFSRRDSFNDKVANYINQAKIKIRTSTNIGDGKSLSLTK